MLDFCALPNDCLPAIISFTSPLDACRLTLVSTLFKSAADSDAVWSKFLPADYQSLIPALPSVSSKKELYLSLCDNPVVIENGKRSFSLDKRSGKKCYMLAAKSITIIWDDTPRSWRWISTPDSRFNEVAELMSFGWFEIRGRISTSMLSPITHYKFCLVVKLTDNAYGFEDLPFEATVGLAGTEGCKRVVYVDVDRDGWFEVELGEFFIKGVEDGELEMSIKEVAGNRKTGLVIQGIEIRPIASY